MIAIPAELTAIMPKYGITTKLQKAHFLANAATETGGFARLTENLNYSTDGLMKVFRKYFPDRVIAAKYARQPEKIANRVYANRYGNRDEASGDGWKFRGRGYSQLTFSDNYRDASLAYFKDKRLLTTPDLACDPKTAADIYGWYWMTRKCGVTADLDDVIATRKLINGGVNGLDHCKEWLSKFKKELSA